MTTARACSRGKVVADYRGTGRCKTPSTSSSAITGATMRRWSAGRARADRARHPRLSRSLVSRRPDSRGRRRWSRRSPRCRAVAVFLGADGLGPWQQRERDLALDRQGREPGFPVIPVLLTRSRSGLGFLKLNTWVDLSAGVADDGGARDSDRRHPRRAARAGGPATDRSRPRRRSAPTAACGRSARRTSRSSSAAPRSPRR